MSDNNTPATLADVAEIVGKEIGIGLAAQMVALSSVVHALAQQPGFDKPAARAVIQGEMDRIGSEQVKSILRYVIVEALQ